MDATAQILAEFGLAGATPIGSGAQSLVYGLDAKRVLRVFRRPADIGTLERLATFLAAIDGRLPCPTSRIEAIGTGGRFTIERRLAGRSMLSLLATLTGAERRRAIEAFAIGAEAVGRIAMPERPYGQLLAAAPIVADTWRDYLTIRLDEAIAANGRIIAAKVGDPKALQARALDLLSGVAEPEKVLVHGDYFPGNVLLDDPLAVSGLVDFSVFTVVGDPILDRAGAAIFLEMVEVATPEDAGFARGVVLERNGPGIAAPAAYYRAYFAFTMADPAASAGPYPRLYPWAIANLEALRNGKLRLSPP